MVTKKITIDELKPKFLDSKTRYNNWYCTAHFNQEGTEYCLKLSLSEGTILGQHNFLSLSSDSLNIVQENGVTVLKKPKNDLNNSIDADDFAYKVEGDQLIVTMGDMTVYCKEDERRFVSKDKDLALDITVKPRGPVFYWGKERNGLAHLTEETEVTGIESLSTSSGEIKTKDKTLKIDNASGLFERVWIQKMNFLQFRTLNWIYANFDQLYTYICHCESQQNDGKYQHFETGKIYLVNTDDYLISDRFEVKPKNWVYLEEVKRFIPWEQNVEIRTDKGTLK